MAAALDAFLSDNTRSTYTIQWRILTGWCDEVGLASQPVKPLAVALYLTAIRPEGVGGGVKVFGLSESQIARRVRAIARAVRLTDW